MAKQIIKKRERKEEDKTTITVSNYILKELQLRKINGNYRSVDEVLQDLLIVTKIDTNKQTGG